LKHCKTILGKKFKDTLAKIKNLGYLNMRDFQMRASREEKELFKKEWKI
jgi:hypothetical protein